MLTVHRWICLGMLGLCAMNVAEGASERELYPWREVTHVLKPNTQVPLNSLLDMKWSDVGGPEGRVAVVTDDATGEKMLDWKIKIDHFNEGQYPQGWPAMETRPDPSLDFSGKRVIRFKMRAMTDVGYPQIVRFILRRHSGNPINVPLSPMTVGKWQQMSVRLNSAAFKDVNFVHFFICEDAYKHGDELDFQIKDFELGEEEDKILPLAAGKAGVTLWLGERADSDSRIVMLPKGTKRLAATLRMENSLGKTVKAGLELRFRIRNVFNGEETITSMKLGQSVGNGLCFRGQYQLDVSKLKSGYYHVLCDVLDDGVSILELRKGSDDFYLMEQGESMTHAMLSLRTGMALWLKDLLHDGFFHSAANYLPHCYDPYDASKENYAVFIKAFVYNTFKHTEGYEAGVPGLVLAAEAFRRNGETERQRFTEGLIDSAVKQMLTMQDECGGVIMMTNELADEGIGKGPRSNARGNYDNNQIGEWMRALNYVALYYREVADRAEFVKNLNDVCRKAGDFIVQYSLRESDGIGGVLRHLGINMTLPENKRITVYHQEGRQCDVYQPRALAGLGYTAYTLQRFGLEVPANWWPMFDATVAWMDKKMKPNGWFDWQCEDIVEGGCHTFLGNIYAGEGLFGVYLADRLAKRDAQADAAKAAALKAYRYVTDDCYIKGNRYQYPLEFWVGPYVYWLFREWRDAVGREAAFEDWLTVLDKRWSEDRKWQDFQRIPGWNCGRADHAALLNLAILGYIGIKQMDEIQKPWNFLQ